MEALPYLAAGIVLGSAGGLSPGPTLTLVIGQTLRHGVSEGLKVAIAPLVTDAPIVLLSMFFLSRLPAGPVLGLIALAGAALLTYLAWESLHAVPPDATAAVTHPGSLRKGALANLLNPHPWGFWLSIGGPILLEASAVGPVAIVAFLVGQYTCLVGAKMTVAWLVDRGRTRLERGYRWAMRVIAAVLLVFAVLFLREAIHHLGPG